MNKEHVKAWIAALRSGQYKQGVDKMYDPKTDCYCVWGVGCKISGVPMMYWEKRGSPPTEVLQYFGIHHHRDIVETWDYHLNHLGLIGLNDYHQFTFDQLADLIEASLNGWDLMVTVRL